MADEVHTPESRVITLTEEQMDHVAERAAQKVFQTIYIEIGKNVLRKLAWLIGVVVIGLALFLAGKGDLPK